MDMPVGTPHLGTDDFGGPKASWRLVVVAPDRHDIRPAGTPVRCRGRVPLRWGAGSQCPQDATQDAAGHLLCPKHVETAVRWSASGGTTEPVYAYLGGERRSPIA